MKMEKTMSENRIVIDTTQLHAAVYFQNAKGVYYAKVSIPSLGMYINSFKISVSPNYPERGLWVQWPSFWIKPKWVKPIEFNNTSEFKALVEEEVLRAVDTYNHEKLLPSDVFDERAYEDQLGQAIDAFNSEQPP